MQQTEKEKKAKEDILGAGKVHKINYSYSCN